MTKKTRLDQQREAALRFDIKSRGKDKDTPNVGMIVIDNKLYIFKEDSIWHAQTADEIDPERIHPETKGGTRQVYDIGTQHPVVFRTVMLAKRLLDSVSFSDPISKDDLLKKYFYFFDLLYTCNSIYERLTNDFIEEGRQFQEALDLSGREQIVGDVPQITRIEEDTKKFFITAKKAIIALSSLTDVFFPEKQKRKNPHKAQNFNQLLEWFSENPYEGNDIHKMIQGDLLWIKTIWEVRNAIEHEENPDYNLEIRNIELAPNCKFHPPRWRYKYPGMEQENLLDLLKDIEVFMNNLVSLGEELFLLCIKDTWNDNFPFLLYKVAEDRLDPQCPIQYGITIDHEKMQKRLETTKG